MEKRLDTLERGSVRYEALRSAIEFKRSWLDLAQRLSAVLQDRVRWRSMNSPSQRDLRFRP